MEKKRDIQILVIPDVHGRDFWRYPVIDTLKNTEAHIVFIGDYVDPYPYEWENADIAEKYAVDVLREIISLKKDYNDRITLLLGNHDCSYALSYKICGSRHDFKNSFDLALLFEDNLRLFKLAEKRNIGDKSFIFSHAGLSREFVNMMYPNTEMTTDEVIERLNIDLTLRSKWLCDNLGIYSTFRGWDGHFFGSVVWSDVREWLIKQCVPIDDSIQIFGHTQLETAINQSDRIYDLDCRQAFYVDYEGVVRYFESGEKIEKKEI